MLRARALAADASCAMAHWGIAFAHGPDYNVHPGNYYPALAKSDGYPSMHAAAEQLPRPRWRSAARASSGR